jgi:hypothetical protein
MRRAPISPDLAIKFEEVELETLPDEEGQNIFPELVLTSVAPAPPKGAEDGKEKKSQARFDEVFVAAIHVIAENWQVEEMVPSRAKFHALTEEKVKAQTGKEEGFGKNLFGRVLDKLTKEGILRRFGEGVGARYQVVLVPGGTTGRKGSEGSAAGPGPGPGPGSKDPGPQVYGSNGPSRLIRSD